MQEHLGRKLRSELRAEDGQPRFLGDPGLPAQFDRLVRRLEAGERGERQGYEAVRDALKRKAGLPPAPTPRGTPDEDKGG